MSVGHLKIICLSLVMVLMGCSDALSPAEVELLNSIEGYWALADDSAATGLCIEVALDTPPEICPCPTGGGEIVVADEPAKSTFQANCEESSGLIYDGTIEADSLVGPPPPINYRFDFPEFGSCIEYQGTGSIDRCEGSFTVNCDTVELVCDYIPPSFAGDCEIDCYVAN